MDGDVLCRDINAALTKILDDNKTSWDVLSIDTTIRPIEVSVAIFEGDLEKGYRQIDKIMQDNGFCFVEEKDIKDTRGIRKYYSSSRFYKISKTKALQLIKNHK